MGILKSKKGFTLLEATIALALWAVLSVGIFLTWYHVSGASRAMRTHQSAFENARIAMDALIINIQMAQDIDLVNNQDGILRQVTLWGFDPIGNLHDYRFHFNPDLQRLEFPNLGNELASHIAELRITYIEGSRMNILIETDCYPAPITLEGSVDVRFKSVTVYP
ncbi:MAG: prepilin-type N-terminal cleavage/methylation domain-containing protein [Defluviitaleaceae bacterium]|nr:prepilin-type N-terminal cleavage/methylation domain-containing protein [Defluviitaleaceae bacterium]